MSKIKIHLLKEHPENEKIYGEENISSLTEAIRKSEWIKPISINQDNVIISGHSRVKAATELGYEEIQFERVETRDKTHLLELLLLENKYREKTNLQMVREGAKWDEIEAERAKQRQVRKPINSVVENFPQQNEKAKTRDKVAEQIGMGSGRSYSTAKDVVKKIDTLAEQGKEKEAKILTAALNRSVSGAQKLSKLSLEQLEEDVAEKIEREEVPVSKVLSAAKNIEKKKIQKQVFEERKAAEIPVIEYDIIYCDPPWRYDFSSTSNRDIENQYPTMSIDEIKSLEIPSAENCLLYMWATAPKLKEALDVIEVWGFEYKTHAIWDKKKIGMGYWFRGQHELLMVAVKGKFSPPEPGDRISSVIEHPRGKHSSKPDLIYDMINRTFPYHSKIELFSRNEVEGWDSWGNENG